MKSLVHLRDQEFFEAFSDIEAKVEAPLESLNFTLGPLKGTKDEWDFDVSLTKEDFGTSSDNMKVTGKGKLADGGEFTFSAPISAAKLQYVLDRKKVQAPPGVAINLNFDQFVWEEKKFDFVVGDVETTGADVSTEGKAAVASAVQNYIFDYRGQIRKQKPQDKEEIHNQDKLPMDSVLPLAALYYGTQLAESIEFKSPFVEIGFSL